MQVDPISAPQVPGGEDVEHLRVLVTSVLGAQEVAVALAVSDMPTRRVALTRDQEIGYAIQGVARLGVDEVRARAVAARNVNLRYSELLDMNGGTVGSAAPEVRALSARERQVWGCGERRQSRAVSVAWKVTGVASHPEAGSVRLAGSAATGG
ncbi:hypothetical protein GA0070558_11953 [Micromonospora haikouensis]|uniref:Uncharacterized protein n=1 Tax=Micromonospora haikouensis TaxID=686309 RepID=A0A1C4WWU6_9ACTN|nr:hypothetical protein [Micromonospora haikouensis]SCF00660.1 hypothetical protein GA0070558_11953 [Micromonospora haikouensis]